MSPPPPASPVRDAWVVLPAALVLLLVLTSFTLLTYRNGVRALVTDRQDEATARHGEAPCDLRWSPSAGSPS